MYWDRNSAAITKLSSLLFSVQLGQRKIRMSENDEKEKTNEGKQLNLHLPRNVILIFAFILISSILGKKSLDIYCISLYVTNV